MLASILICDMTVSRVYCYAGELLFPNLICHIMYFTTFAQPASVEENQVKIRDHPLHDYP